MKILVLLMLGMALAAQTVHARSGYVSQMPNGAIFGCANCHVNPVGGGTRTAFGNAFLSNGDVWNATVATPDSDGDGYSNGVELGDPSGAWRPGQANPAGPVYNPGVASSNPGTTVTAPVITAQPASQTVTAGANVTFTVSATGTAPLSYQWMKGGVNISGATTATLTLSGVTTASAGSYTVRVSNSAGSVTSAAATLTVNVAASAPAITTQPASQTVSAGANVTFTVSATGTAPLSYQWMQGGVNISGATTATLTLSSVTTADAGSYSVLVRNSVGSITSAAATLTVSAAVSAPTITTQPASQTVTAGATVTFTVSATGTAPLSYQWMKGGVNISGATTSTLTLSSVSTADAGSYSVLVRNSAGSITSAAATLTVSAVVTAAPGTTLLGWNNLGMHCMDRDFSVFSVLPPYNTIEAQLIVKGRLVTNGTGYSVSYQAVADPAGSINTTSVGKGNFYSYTPYLYGSLAPDMGLLGWAMPGAANTPQGMLFEKTNQPVAGVFTPVNWFRAEGIPITPYDDAGRTNSYPLMRLIARNSANQPIATNDIVVPVSDEMDCRACHATGAQLGAEPLSGWASDPNPERDYRLNILRLHDDLNFVLHAADYSAALAARGFNPTGLYTNVVADGKPVLCAACHLSEALQGSGYGSLPPLTRAIHSRHANVTDPVLNMTLGDAGNRQACYRCHPGSVTRCLRGAMGSAVAADGTMEMQCQSCHGTLNQVASPSRTGWFDEPNCQSCHTGTATSNSGQIRYSSVFTDTNYTVRVAANQTFATSSNAPAAGLSLYRFSTGHGGLQCEACHGSTHAEFPTPYVNDNLRNTALQGHIGMMSECTACHTNSPSTVNGGPHGMHPVGQTWVSGHQSAAGSACRACHGLDYRGTVLSRALADRTLNANGTQNLFRGATIGCYLCHNGPGGSGTPPAAPTVSNVSASTTAGQPVSMVLPATGTSLTLRIITQAANGTVGLSNNIATYFPDAGFSGTDTFTFAAYNGSKNSQLGTGTVTVAGSPAVVAPTITRQPIGQTVAAGANVTLSVTATGTAPLRYQWQKNSIIIPGATNASLTLNNVATADAGSYAVQVSNAAGSVMSAYAILTVSAAVAPPAITTQPTSRTVAAGANVTFSVAATGTAPLSYQWQKNGVNIAGATSAALTLTSVTTSSAGSYRVIVSNSAGSITSAAATLTVTAGVVAPAITPQPASQTATAGANVTFSVAATGTAPLSYRWQKNGVNITGAASATLTLTSVTTNSAGSYRVIVSNSAGSVTSAAATLTVSSSTFSVRLTTPVNGAVYTEPARVLLTASVSSRAPIARVRFYDGTSLLGTDSTAPFSITTTGLGSGTHVFTARATDTYGRTVTSASVKITVRGSDDD
jgi:hypothetical protein